MGTSLNGIALPAETTRWIDENDWTPVGQSEEIDIHGGLVVEYVSPPADGRPVTLHLGWITKIVLDQLKALRDAETQDIMPLELPDGRTMNVLWRHTNAKPIDAIPIQDYTISADDDFFDTTLSLLQNNG